jgi:catechol 2,3-dioxygenase-like lactoylglutathione lyase family enzyme
VASAHGGAWPGPVTAVTLFVEDLPAAKAFYAAVFSVPLRFEDADSAVFDFGNMLVNLLRVEAAPELVEPATVAARGAGARVQFTIEADDVDAIAGELTRRGVTLLNGPMDRSWGVRTLSFMDPGGHIWEVAKTDT